MKRLREVLKPARSKFLLTLFLTLTFTMSASSQIGELTLPIIKDNLELRKFLLHKRDATPITLLQASKTGLLQNTIVQTAMTQWRIAELETLKSKGRYDTQWNAAYTLVNDKAERAAIVLGSGIKERQLKTGLSKKLPTGTTVGADWEMSWNLTDSAFSSLNPNYKGKSTITLEQALLRNFLGVIDRTEVNIARLTGKIQKASMIEEIEDELLEIRTAFWDLALSFENYNTFRQFLTTSEELLKIGERKYTYGTLEKADFLNLMSQTRLRAEQLIRIANTLKLKSNSLAYLLNIDPSLIYIPDDTLTILESEPPKEEILATELETAFEKRAAYKEAELRVKQLGLEVKRDFHNLLPDLTARASWGSNGLDSKLRPSAMKTFNKEHLTYEVGVEFSTPLANRESRAEWRQSKLGREEAVINLKQTAALINREVQDAFYTVISLHMQLTQSKKRVVLEEEKYKEEKKQFEIGRSNSERLTQFQNDWVRSQFDNAAIRKNLLVTYDELSAARGTLFEDSGLTSEDQE